MRALCLSALLLLLAPDPGQGQWLPVGPPGSVTSPARLKTTIFAGTNGGGISVSSDDGLSWHTANTGLTNLGVTALTLLGTRLYASTGGGGVFGGGYAGGG